MQDIVDSELEVEDQEQELFEHFRFELGKGQELLRIDKYLMNHIKSATRTKIQQTAEAGNVLVNDKPVKSNYRVKPFDVISIVLAHPPRDKQIKPENIPLNIVYEDDQVVVVNKASNMVVHPGFGNYSGTLVNAMMSS